MTSTDELHPRSTASGKYIDKVQGAPGVSLGADDTLARLIELHTRPGYGPLVVEDQARAALASAEAAGMDTDFLIEYLEKVGVDSSHRHDVPTALELHLNGRTPAELAALIELEDGKYRPHSMKLLAAGATVERIAELRELGVPANPQALVALADLNDQIVTSWIGVARENEAFRTWVTHWPTVRQLHDGEITPDRAVTFANAGIDAATVAAIGTRFTPREARAYAEESGLAPEEVGAYFRHHIEHVDDASKYVPAAVAKAYGSAISPADTAAFNSRGIRPKPARSLRAANRALTTGDVEALVNANVQSGAEYRAWRKLVAPDNRASLGSGRSADHNPFSREVASEISRIVLAKSSGTTPEEATSYTRLGFKNPKHWAELRSAGITDGVEWGTALRGTGRANALTMSGTATRDDLAAASFVAFAKAGGTPQLLAQMQRAGIPLTEAHEHVQADDVWAAGAKFREQTIAHELAQGSRWGGRTVEPKPWEWTAETYR